MGVPEPPIVPPPTEERALFTKAVVAIEVSLSRVGVVGGVGAFGSPVKVGEASGALASRAVCKSVCAESVPVIKPQVAVAGGELCQEARPVASVATKTFPGPGAPPEMVIVPPTVAFVSAISGPRVRRPPTTRPPLFC